MRLAHGLSVSKSFLVHFVHFVRVKVSSPYLQGLEGLKSFRSQYPLEGHSCPKSRGHPPFMTRLYKFQSLQGIYGNVHIMTKHYTAYQ